MTGTPSTAAASPDPTASSLQRRDFFIALVLALLMGLASAFLCMPEALGTGHDDGIYVITARALAEGQGYRLIHLPGTPRQTKYPPLFPALLAVLWWLLPEFPANLPLLHLLPWLSGMGVIGMSYLYLVRFGYATRFIAALACLFCLTAAIFALQSAMIASDMPFGVLWLTAMWQLELLATTTGKPSRRADFLLGLVCGLPTLCRMVGVALVPAALFIGWRSKRSVLWMGMGMALMIAPWFLWAKTSWGQGQRNDVLGYYTDYVGWWQDSAWRELGTVLTQNFQVITWTFAGASQQGLSTWAAEQSYFWQFAFILQGFVGWCMLAAWGRRFRVVVLCLLPYIGLVWLWPWVSSRFLMPFLPLLTAALLMGYRTCLPYRGKVAWLVYAVLITTVVAMNLWDWSRFADGTPTPDGKLYSRGNLALMRQTQAELQAWLRANTQPADLIAVDTDPATFLYTGRATVRPYTLRPLEMYYKEAGNLIGTPTEFRQMLLRFRPQWLVTSDVSMDRVSMALTDFTQQFHLTHPDWLTPVYRAPSRPRAVIYAVHLDKIAAGK